MTVVIDDSVQPRLCPDAGMQVHVMNIAWDAVEADGAPALVAQTGSRAYGTHKSDSDYDFKGVYVARLDRVCSLRAAAQTRDLSDPYDLTLYELAHFCKLAAAANPTVLEVLWSENRWQSPVGKYLRSCRSLFLSKRIIKTYGDYAQAQMQKAQKGTGGSRGADHLTRDKFKLHTLRLLDAGLHALQTGEIQVEVPDPELLARRASVPLDQLAVEVEEGYRVMEYAAERSSLPDEPNIELIDCMMFNIRVTEFAENAGVAL